MSSSATDKPFDPAVLQTATPSPALVPTPPSSPSATVANAVLTSSPTAAGSTKLSELKAEQNPSSPVAAKASAIFSKVISGLNYAGHKVVLGFNHLSNVTIKENLKTLSENLTPETPKIPYGVIKNKLSNEIDHLKDQQKLVSDHASYKSAIAALEEIRDAVTVKGKGATSEDIVRSYNSMKGGWSQNTTDLVNTALEKVASNPKTLASKVSDHFENKILPVITSVANKIFGALADVFRKLTSSEDKTYIIDLSVSEGKSPPTQDSNFIVQVPEGKFKEYIKDKQLTTK